MKSKLKIVFQGIQPICIALEFVLLIIGLLASKYPF